MINKILILFLFFTLCGCSKVSDDLPDVISLLKEKTSKEYFEERIYESIKDDKLGEAKSYQSLAKLIGTKIDNSEINKMISENDNAFNNTWRSAKNMTTGFVFGESENAEQFMGAVASDMMVVGDIRDFSKETINYVNDNEVDYFTYSLSALGLGATVASVATLGGATPAKGGISFLKIANKTKKISSSLLANVNKLVKNSIDIGLLKKQLKKIDIKNVSLLKKEIKKSFNKSTDLTKLVKLTNNISDIKRSSGSYSNALKIIKYADTTTEVSKLTKLSNKFGKNTVLILKILGKNAFKTLGFFMSIVYYICASIFWLFQISIWMVSIVILKKGFLGVVTSVTLVGLSYQFLSFGMVYSLFF